MFIEAIDKLRCVREHEDSWLVAKFVEMRERDFREGELGCPVCGARYPVRGGIAYFSPVQPAYSLGRKSICDDDLFALAAMLDLSAPERTIVLCDTWTRFAAGLCDIAQPRIFVVNSLEDHSGSEQVYAVASRDAIPLAPGSVDAIALDRSAGDLFIKSGIRALRESGRMVGSSQVTPPEGVTLLASDDEKWVALKTGGFIPLRRASR